MTTIYKIDYSTRLVEYLIYVLLNSTVFYVIYLSLSTLLHFSFAFDNGGFMSRFTIALFFGAFQSLLTSRSRISLSDTEIRSSSIINSGLRVKLVTLSAVALLPTSGLRKLIYGSEELVLSRRNAGVSMPKKLYLSLRGVEYRTELIGDIQKRLNNTQTVPVSE